MSTLHCHTIGQGGAGDRQPAPLLRRGGEMAGWVIPSATLALLPKCPACVAAYVALATGVGVSIPAASYIRTTAFVLCVLSLSYLAARRARRVIAWALGSKVGRSARHAGHEMNDSGCCGKNS